MYRSQRHLCAIPKFDVLPKHKLGLKTHLNHLSCHLSLTAPRYLHSIRRYVEVTIAAPPVRLLLKLKRAIYAAITTFFISKSER